MSEKQKNGFDFDASGGELIEEYSDDENIQENKSKNNQILNDIKNKNLSESFETQTQNTTESQLQNQQINDLISKLNDFSTQNQTQNLDTKINSSFETPQNSSIPSQITETSSIPFGADVPEVESPVSDEQEPQNADDHHFEFDINNPPIPPLQDDFEGVPLTSSSSDSPKNSDNEKSISSSSSSSESIDSDDSIEEVDEQTPKRKTQKKSQPQTMKKERKTKQLKLHAFSNQVEDDMEEDNDDFKIYRMIENICHSFDDRFSFTQVLATIHCCAGDVHKAIDILNENGPLGDSPDLLKISSVQGPKSLIDKYFGVIK